MLGYPYQNTFSVIGSKSGTTRTPVALETTYDAALTKSFKTGGMSKVNVSILYTMGATEASNSIEMRVRTSSDGTNWYQIPNESASAGTSTLTLREFTYVGVNAAASSISVPLDVQDEYMELAFKETGVATNAGTIFVEATLSGAS